MKADMERRYLASSFESLKEGWHYFQFDRPAFPSITLWSLCVNNT